MSAIPSSQASLLTWQ